MKLIKCVGVGVGVVDGVGPIGIPFVMGLVVVVLSFELDLGLDRR